MEVRCELCGFQLPVEGLRDHLRVLHPDVEALETWPDGRLVIIDHTLEPDDFA